MSDEGFYMADPRIFDSPRDDDRPLYERMIEIDRGPITGTLMATGASVDEIIVGASEQIRRVAGERGVKIRRVELRPLLTETSGAIRLWSATVEFEVESD